jgi:acetylornithine deacetylase/succinyl-diaminopimelate desuccinylase-like protein
MRARFRSRRREPRRAGLRGARTRGCAAAGALAAVLAAACAGEKPPPPSAEQAAPSLSLGARAASILSRAIRHRTENPPGDERPLAAELVSLLREGGLEAALVETPPGASSVGRAAAWGRLRGRGGRRPIVLLSHLDVVPARGEHWRLDPFAGSIEEGRVHGRGALDAKGVSVVHLLTLLELAARGSPLERDVIFLATPDEETGGVDGSGYLVREHPELLGEAGYLLTEGGSIGLGERRSVWGVAVTEKSPCWMRVIARGTPGHSSVPPVNAAGRRLIRALDRALGIERPVRVVPAVERMYAALAPVAPAGDARGFAHLSSELRRDATFRRRFLADAGNAARVRNTLAVTVLEGSSSTNIVSATAAAHLDARLLPGASCQDFAARIRAAIRDPDVEVRVLLAFPSRESPIDTPLYRAIERVAAAVDPGALVVPRVVAGFTDAHYFRELGIVAYGFVPRWLAPGDSAGIHGPDERVSIDNLVRGVETLIAILAELDRAEQ